MRKHIFIFLAVAMLFAILNACSDETSAKSESTDISAVSDDSYDNVSTTVTDDSESAVTDSISTSITAELCKDDMIVPEVYCIQAVYHDDENGDMIKEYTMHKDIDGNDIYTQYYDEAGEVQYEYYYSYIFSDDGRILKEKQISCTYGEQKRSVISEYTYNSDNTQVNHVEYEDGEWKADNIFLYDEHGEFIGMRTKWSEDDSEYSPFGCDYVYAYDDNDRIVLKRSVNAESRKTISETVYNYNEFGQLINQTTIDVKKNEETATHDYTYDENGNCVHRLRETVSEDETILNEEIYAYDKNNRKITEKRYTNGELTTELVFEYV